MSHIITSHQLLGTSKLLGLSTEHSLKQSYLAKRIAKLSRILDAYLSILDRKTTEINGITHLIDALHALSHLSGAQKKQLKQLIETRASIEKWVMSSRLMRKINEIRYEVDALNESTLDTYDDYTL